MSILGQLVNIMVGANKWPGVIVTDPSSETRSIVSRDPARHGARVNIEVRTANVVSLRETNPANGPVTAYLTMTPENLRFVTPRFARDEHGNNILVEGLDYSAGGEKISVQRLVGLAEDAIMAYTAQRQATAPEPALVIDESIELEPDTEVDFAPAAAKTRAAAVKA